MSKRNPERVNGTKSDRDHGTLNESRTFEQRHEKGKETSYINIREHSVTVSAMAQIKKVPCTGEGCCAWNRGNCGQRGLKVL